MYFIYYYFVYAMGNLLIKCFSKTRHRIYNFQINKRVFSIQDIPPNFEGNMRFETKSICDKYLYKSKRNNIEHIPTTIRSYNKNYVVKYSRIIRNPSSDFINLGNQWHEKVFADFRTRICGLYNAGDYVIIDSNIYNIYRFNQTVGAEFEIPPSAIFIFEATELNKSMGSVLDIVRVLELNRVNKSNKIIVIGGGITQDVGGFAATMYKRGIPWVFIPTTLLAMADSCIGGKLCLNHAGSKNILSIFNAPNAVYIYPDLIITLPEDDIVSGMGEIYKLCIIGGADVCLHVALTPDYNYFDTEWRTYIDYYMNLIQLSHIIKKVIIEEDEFDAGERRALNYGHTFGHAIEAATNYYIPHGIAVLYGIYIVNRLFYDDFCRLNDDDATEINIFNSINDFIVDIIPAKYKINVADSHEIDISMSDIFDHVLADKKNTVANKIKLVVLEHIGQTRLVDYELTDENRERITEIFDTCGFNTIYRPRLCVNPNGMVTSTSMKNHRRGSGGGGGTIIAAVEREPDY